MCNGSDENGGNKNKQSNMINRRLEKKMMERIERDFHASKKKKTHRKRGDERVGVYYRYTKP
jgi:hypothetical protein